MKMSAFVAPLLLGASLAFAQVPAPAPGSTMGKAATEQEVIYEGELETHIAVGGESTGWRLRTRTAQGQRRFIEVLLTAEVAQGVRANTRVQVRGAMKTRHYAERGDVEVLVARSVIEVARTR
jgi:hypothetical protein